jgi:hypothetical protein
VSGFFCQGGPQRSEEDLDKKIPTPYRITTVGDIPANKCWVEILNQRVASGIELMKIGNVPLSSASKKSALAQPAIRASILLSTTCSMRDK